MDSSHTTDKDMLHNLIYSRIASICRTPFLMQYHWGLWHRFYRQLQRSLAVVAHSIECWLS